MQGSDVVDAALRLSQVSLSLSDADLDECVRLGAAIEAYLFQKAERFARDCAHEPLLVCYMCDGWSCDLSRRHIASADTGKTIEKTVKWRGEFMLERAILRSAPMPGDPGIRMLMSPLACCREASLRGMSSVGCATLCPTPESGATKIFC